MKKETTDQPSPITDDLHVEGVGAASHKRSAAITGASIICFLYLGSPLVIPILVHVIRNRELLEIFGVGTLMGGGFIESLGIDAVIVSILVFMPLCVFEVLAGFWLWKSQKKGGILALVLLPLFMIIAIGWVDVMLLIGMPIQGVLLLLGWKSLR